MSQRVSLPSSLSNQQVSPSTLQRSGEGVTLANQTTIPNQSGSSLSSQAARIASVWRRDGRFPLPAEGKRIFQGRTES